MGKSLLLIALLASSAWAQKVPLKSAVQTFNKQSAVKIGTLWYAGGSVDQFGDTSSFHAKFETEGITKPITFGDLEMFVVSCPNPNGPCNAASQDLRGQGPVTTTANPDILWLGGHDGTGLVYTLPNCNDFPCVCIELQLVSVDGKPFTVTLANGQTFTAPGITTVELAPLPGQLFIQPGQMADIVLQRDNVLLPR